MQKLNVYETVAMIEFVFFIVATGCPYGRRPIKAVNFCYGG